MYSTRSRVRLAPSVGSLFAGKRSTCLRSRLFLTIIAQSFRFVKTFSRISTESCRNTTDMRSRHPLLKYSQKYGRTKDANRYKTKQQYLDRRRRQDGTSESRRSKNRSALMRASSAFGLQHRKGYRPFFDFKRNMILRLEIETHPVRVAENFICARRFVGYHIPLKRFFFVSILTGSSDQATLAGKCQYYTA